MNVKEGLAFALLAAVLWSVGAFLCLHGLELERGLSSLAGTLARIAVNLAFVLFVQFVVRKERGLPWGSGGLALWAWGALGALTIVTYFASIQALGVGEATLLQGVQGLVVASLAPFFLRQRAGWMSWAAVVGGLCGLRLVLSGGAAGNLLWEGRALALASGFFAGCAYLLLSAVRGRHRPDTISFYWCLVSLLATGTLALVMRVPIPVGGPALPWLLGAGLAGSLAQWFTTLAYQNAPAAFVASTSYLIPIFGLLGEVLVRNRHLEGRVWAGGALVLLSGMGLPYLQAQSAVTDRSPA